MPNIAARTIFAAVLGISIFAIGDDAPSTEPTTQHAKTGSFEITYTQRSPLSEYSKLLTRFNTTKDELGPDYNLADEPFVMHVPADYDRSKPPGLLVLSDQDGVQEIFDWMGAIMDAHHLILICTKKDHLPFGTNAGACLDAVYNVSQSYAIDPKRVYLMGLSKFIEPIGLCTGDVFDGDIYIWWCDYFRKVGIDPLLVKYKPSPAMLRLDDAHMQILAFNLDPSQVWYETAMARAMAADDFDHVVVAPVGHDDVLSPAWFEQTLKVLESVKPPRSTTAAAPDEPAQLLRLAQAYISSGLTDKARDKLNLLIQKYPNDPSAAKAKELLSQLNSQ